MQCSTLITTINYCKHRNKETRGNRSTISYICHFVGFQSILGLKYFIQTRLIINVSHFTAWLLKRCIPKMIAGNSHTPWIKVQMYLKLKFIYEVISFAFFIPKFHIIIYKIIKINVELNWNLNLYINLTS